MNVPVSAQPVRVLHIFGRMDRGGAEMRTIELMRELSARDIRFEFATLTHQPGDLDNEIQALGGKVHRLGFSLASVARLLALLRKGGFDVIHSHVHYFSAIPLCIAALAAVPVRIAHFRSTGDGIKPSPLRRFRNAALLRLLSAAATHLVGVSQASLEQSLPSALLREDRCQVIYSGIDFTPFRSASCPARIRAEFGIPAHAPIVVHVGRMAPEKNHRRLADIFARLQTLVPECWLLLVGRRDPVIERQICDRKTSHTNIVFAGLRTDTAELLRASNLMIFPSQREGLPGAVLEASAAGIPVLASRIPGLIELDGQLPGLELLDLSASDDLWAQRAGSLLGHPRATIAAPAKLPAHFDARQAAESFELIYRSAARPQAETGLWGEPTHV